MLPKPAIFKASGLALLMLVAGFENCLAQAAIEEENLVAALSLNIVRFTTWPEPNSSPFNLCVYGDNVTKEAFNSLEAKPLGSRNIHIVTFDRLIDLDRCQALYINDIKPNLLSQVFNELKKRPILTLGSTESFAENGGMIGLRKVNGKLTIDINLRVTNEAGILISSRLLSLANIVEQ